MGGEILSLAVMVDEKCMCFRETEVVLICNKSSEDKGRGLFVVEHFLEDSIYKQPMSTNN